MRSSRKTLLATPPGRAYGGDVRRLAISALAVTLLAAPIGGFAVAATEQTVEVLNPPNEQQIEILTPPADQQVGMVDSKGVEQGISSGETSPAARVAGNVGKGVFGVVAVAVAMGTMLASLLLM